VLRAYPRCDQKTAIQFIDHTLSKLPFAVERVQTDNGSEFGASFHWHLLDLGIDHVKIKPRTPRLNGKVCEDWLGAAPGRSDPGKGVTVVSCFRYVGRAWCSVVARTGQTELT
jgi:transposase InsO family protein